MLLKLRGMCAVLLAALAFAGCSDDDAASSLATNFDELEFSYEESDQQLLIRSTVPWTLDCTYLTGDGWLAFDKTSGPGDEGIVSQRVTIKALHNTGVERTAELHITGAGFDRKVTVVQEDGQVRIDGVELEGDMAKDEQVEKTYIAVNYSRAVGGEKLTVTPTLSGEGSDGLSVAAGEVTLDAGSGVARMAVTGTPTTFGEVLFKVAVELGDKSFGPYEVKSETANRMAAPTGLYVFRADSHEIIMEWDNDHSTVRTRKWAWQLLDSDADDAGVVREFTYEVNSNDDKNPKYVYNRFIIGALDPGTTYYFRVKTVGNYSFQGSKGTVTIKATNGESDFSPVITLRTEAEHTPAANEILYQGFDNITMQSDFINTAAGTTPYWSDKAIVSKQADTPNPWEGAWVVYPFANSHLLATWGMASTANYIDGQATYKGQANRIAGDKSGSLKGWYIGDQVSPHQGYVKVGTSSKDGFYIATPALDSPLLSAEGTLCTFSFKGCPLMTDGRVVDIEVYRAATKTFEKVTSITMDSTLADGWTSSDYLCNYKWTTYSIDITLHPGDNVAVISTNKSRFAIDDIMIVKK